MPFNTNTKPSLPVRALVGGPALAFVAAFGFLWLEANATHAARSRGIPTAAKQVHARVAKAERLNELMRMRITSVKGKRVSAQGSASGTVAGAVSFNLVLSSASGGTAEFYGHNSQGTINGRGTARYSVAGAISYFGGTVTSLRGSGRYSHASNLGIQFSGTVNRRTYEVTLRLNGNWHA